jgi:hypothetical protein
LRSRLIDGCGLALLDGSAVREWSSDMRKLRRPHPIVQVVENTASELNDILNAIGLRLSLLRHQLEASTSEAEIARLAGLIDKASERVRRLEEYARAEELVASMRPGRARKKPESSGLLTDERPGTALLITDPSNRVW